MQNYIEVGLDEGATLVAGGPGKPAGLDRVWFVQPTVFADVTNDASRGPRVERRVRALREK